ncbi:ABC transporter [Sanguibacteroides justesenii]|uniref:Gldg family protein n=1 Tax=Sanguibacteroides justesenii TaxID=1547597 RepID=UPI000D87F38A|nr:Gldg family protein [Sanguibacteroides justesenii]PXZ43978.1 ABC transporter [Sanguibacteroides justesenii]
MRKIYKIAITELRTLFYSPVAWLILVIFTVQAAMSYTGLIDTMLTQQFSRPLWYSIVRELFTRSFSLYPTMLGNLYLYIPLLTMGLMSREYSSGSIKLLYSSPVSTTQIVLGKYLSMMLYNLILGGILLVFVFLTGFNVPNFDYTLALSGVLGLYLVVCAYAAIGLFMSCLTSYQVVAAVSTLAVLAFLNYVGRLGQDIPLVRDITYWLSIQGRSSQMIEGLITSEDVLYFLIVIGLFLSLSVIKILSGKKRNKGLIVTRYFVVTFLALFLGYLSSRPVFKFYYDASATKLNTLAQASREVMEKMDGGLTVTTYVNLLESHYLYGIPSGVNGDKDRFKEYTRFKPRMKMKYVYYYKDVKDSNNYLTERFSGLTERQKAEKVAVANDLNMKMFLTPEELSHQIDLSGENYRFVRVIERDNGRKTFLRVYDDGYVFPNEAEISTAMKRLVTDVPVVAFVVGHGERDIRKAGDRDYYTFAQSPTFRHSLINKGFDTEVLDLSKVGEVSPEVDVLVIPDPYTAFSSDDIDKLNRYIDRGGNLVIAGEPAKQSIMNPITRMLGVEFIPGELVQPTGVYNDNLLICRFNEEGVNVMTSYKNLLNRYGIVMPGASALSFDTTRGFRVAPVLTTSGEGSWNELEGGDKAVFNPRVGEVQGAYPTMLALTRQVGDREQRIVVLGDADCISNSELLMNRIGVQTSNFSLITGMFRWLSYGEFPLSITRPAFKDTVLELTREGMPLTSLLLTWIFPALFVLGGVGVWMKRRLG